MRFIMQHDHGGYAMSSFNKEFQEEFMRQFEVKVIKKPYRNPQYIVNLPKLEDLIAFQKFFKGKVAIEGRKIWFNIGLEKPNNY